VIAEAEDREGIEQCFVAGEDDEVGGVEGQGGGGKRRMAGKVMGEELVLRQVRLSEDECLRMIEDLSRTNRYRYLCLVVRPVLLFGRLVEGATINPSRVDRRRAGSGRLLRG
jgi:hypothetical protein